MKCVFQCVYLLFWWVEGVGNHVKTRENKLNCWLISQLLTPTHPSDISISYRAIIMRRIIDNCTAGSSNP